jgi:aldehyde dehydrogenase (NAD+)
MTLPRHSQPDVTKMPDATRFYIDGIWVDPISPDRRKIIDPSTETPIGQVALAGASDVDRAVAAARAAFPTFAATSRAERLVLLRRITELYAARMIEIAESVMRELGAPRAYAHDTQAWIGLAHLEKAVETLEHYRFEEERGSTLVAREPAGVAALITPWNWPLNQIVCKVAPALATGCTMVLKPSENTPTSAALFAQILHDAGVPAGVFNLIQGEGPVAGRAMAAHPGIDLISFTGSTRAGIDVATIAASTVKRVLQELGGKSPFIVLPDADLAAAIASCAATVFGNTGQSCDSPTRLLVPANLQAEAQSLASQAARACRVGDPADPETTMGPLVSERQFNHVQRLLQSGVAEGATLVTGGPGRPPGLNRGYYVQPTVFGDVTLDMTIARDEIFGPVICVISYDDEADAIRIGNDTQYGLAAYVHGKDMARVRRVARALRAGMIAINDPPLDLGAPFGGYKQSGNGREYADFGFDDFTEIKGMIGYGPACES